MERAEPASPGVERRSLAMQVVVICVIGVGAGLAGMLLALLLHLIQHLAYGYSAGHIVSSESFLAGVTGSDPTRRVLAMAACGLIAGFGWWAIYRFGKPLVSVKRAVTSDQDRMPGATTTAHALLQIVTVALGSPLGREVAPREAGAVFASWICDRAGITAGQRKIMIACGAGAGLAAVYNVPLGGTIFVLEVLLGTFAWSAVLPAMATSGIAAIVAWIGLGNESQYVVPTFDISASLVVWSTLCGPLFGLAAYGFHEVTKWARDAAPKDWKLPVISIVNFMLIGVLAIWYPQLLGNGKGPAGLSFDDNLTIGLAATLLVLKVVITASSLRSGAQGGLLTPSLTNGALLAIVLGGLWNLIWPGTSLGAFAIVGAAAFLGSAMKMPLTAVVLILEFTRVNHDFLIPILFSLGGSAMTFSLLDKRLAQPSA